MIETPQTVIDEPDQQPQRDQEFPMLAAESYADKDKGGEVDAQEPDVIIRGQRTQVIRAVAIRLYAVLHREAVEITAPYRRGVGATERAVLVRRGRRGEVCRVHEIHNEESIQKSERDRNNEKSSCEPVSFEITPIPRRRSSQFDSDRLRTFADRNDCGPDLWVSPRAEENSRG